MSRPRTTVRSLCSGAAGDCAKDAAGIREDPAHGDVWFTLFGEKKSACLRPASETRMASDDVVDNCVGVYNPSQANADKNFVDLSAMVQRRSTMSPGRSPTTSVTPATPTPTMTASRMRSSRHRPRSAVLPLPAPTNPLMRDSDGDLTLDGANARLAPTQRIAAVEAARSSDRRCRSGWPSRRR